MRYLLSSVFDILPGWYNERKFRVYGKESRENFVDEDDGGIEDINMILKIYYRPILWEVSVLNSVSHLNIFELSRENKDALLQLSKTGTVPALSENKSNLLSHL